MRPSSPQSYGALRLGLIFLLFAVLVLPFRWFGRTRGPAQKVLEDLPAAPVVSIIGDSRAHVGIAPRLLLRVFAAAGFQDLSAYNFAEDGTDALHHVDLLQGGLLRLPLPPRLLLWAPNPLSFDGSRQSNRLERLPPAVIPPLASSGAPVELLLDMSTMAVFSPFRHRPAIKLFLEDIDERAGLRLLPLQRLLGLTYTPRQRRRIYTEHPDGQASFTVIADWEGQFQRSLRSYHQSYDRLELSDFHFDLMANALGDAAQRGCLVVVIEMPLSPTYRRELATNPKHLAYRARVAALTAVEGALFLSFAERFNDDHLFGDPAHMAEAAAADFSTALAQALLREPGVVAALAGPRRGRDAL